MAACSFPPCIQLIFKFSKIWVIHRIQKLNETYQDNQSLRYRVINQTVLPIGSLDDVSEQNMGAEQLISKQMMQMRSPLVSRASHVQKRQSTNVKPVMNLEHQKTQMHSPIQPSNEGIERSDIYVSSSLMEHEPSALEENQEYGSKVGHSEIFEDNESSDIRQQTWSNQSLQTGDLRNSR